MRISPRIVCAGVIASALAGVACVGTLDDHATDEPVAASGDTRGDARVDEGHAAFDAEPTHDARDATVADDAGSAAPPQDPPQSPTDAGATPTPDDAAPKPVDASTAAPDTFVVDDTGAPIDTSIPIDASSHADTGHASIDASSPDVSIDASIDTSTAPTDASTVAPTYVTQEVTFYGWADNSPPGPAISNPIVHTVAGGTGSYADPITFATALGEWPAGTILYVPFLQRYVIMEDTCAECITDWASGKHHIDVWMDSDATHASALLACEDAWTRAAVDVEVHPPPDRPVSTAPLFDPSTGVCRSTP